MPKLILKMFDSLQVKSAGFFVGINGRGKAKSRFVRHAISASDHLKSSKLNFDQVIELANFMK